MTTHTFGQFDIDINELRQEMLKMLKLARRNTKQAINALLNSDIEKAERVIASDGIINALEVDIDRKARLMVVHHQPVASDLRFVFTTLKITTDIERISDLASCIARVAKESPDVSSANEVMVMKPLILNMFRMIRRAIVQSDAELASQVITYDYNLNNSCHTVDRALHSFIMEDPSRTTECFKIAGVSKRIERIGDHLKHIAQMVIYLTKGQEVRHVNPQELEQFLAEEDDDDDDIE
ncbi:MAG: phosphate signaling complex protein PhoU [Mariprofundales bacterium]|nr:phosphate signaling complex protein PhoU [Mariprofundales bacterium]